MSEQKVGTARIDITGDASGIEAATVKASESIREMTREARAEYRSLSEVERKRIDALMRQGQSLREALNGTKSAGDVLFNVMRALPLPIAAAGSAVASFSLAAYQGSNELKELNKELLLTGNAVGVTTDQVSTMAARLGDLKGATRGQAVNVLTEIISNGKIARDQLETVAGTAIRANNTVGRAISDTIDKFVELGEKPTENAAKLNQQYNFLTLSVYEQIRALEEQGRTQDAAKLAQDEYSRVTNERLDQVNSNLGVLERGWNAIADAARKGWDAMAGIGREKTTAEQIADLDRQIASAEAALANPSLKALDYYPGVDYKGNIQTVTTSQVVKLRAEKDRLAKRQESEDYIALLQGHERDQIALSNARHEYLTGGRSKQQKKQDDLAAEGRKWVEMSKGLEKGSAEYEKLYEAHQNRVADIEKKYKDRKTTGSGPKNDEATRLLQSYQQQEASLRAQLQVNDKLGTHQKRLVEFEQQIVDLKTKKTLTADERSLLLNEGKLRAQLKINASLEQEQETHQAIVKVQERSAQIIEQMASSRDNTNAQYQRELDAYGMGDKAMQRLQDQRSIYKEFERYQRQLANATDFSKAGAAAQYAEETAKIEAELQRRLLMQQNYYATIDEMQGSWLLGANHGLANYADEAANAFLNTSNLVNKSFKSMEDSLVEFARTGKLSFSDLADSVIRDLMRIMIQQSVMGPLASMFGGLFGGGAGTGNLTGGSLSGATWFGPSAVGGNGLSGLAKLWSGGYTGDGGKYDPAGIVHKGEGVLNADEIRAIGGEAGFNALRQSIRGIGHSMGGMASKPVATPQLMAPKQQQQQPINIYSTVHAAPGTNAAELSAMLDQRDKQLRYQIYEELRRGRVEV
ncbi:phage tail tape measure protein [Paenalcaligenes suwonensis]|uniref:phage tail tape measure protein n=1 Tax=Paenalcaligenes suwonensis TaxID=1202713 RepID=UPI001408AE23|nr:phage tail tape measure protein [Paenalcaligenes suwonensis]NHC63109.1 phage tail tape measure protein [Paenalcaligenes suwonensis]